MTRFSIHDQVRVVRADSDWEYWCSAMNNTVGFDGVVVDYETDLEGERYATVLFTCLDGEIYFFRDCSLEYSSLFDDNETLESKMSISELLGGLNSA